MGGSLGGWFFISEGSLTAVSFASNSRYLTTWNVEPESDLKYVRKILVEIVEESMTFYLPKLSGIDFQRALFTVLLSFALHSLEILNLE